MNKKNLVCGEQKDKPNSLLYPIQIPLKLPRTIFSPIIQQVGVRKNFVQSVLQCWTMILDHLCRGRRIRKSGLSDCGITSNLGASSIFYQCMLIRRQLLVHHSVMVLL